MGEPSVKRRRGAAAELVVVVVVVGTADRSGERSWRSRDRLRRLKNQCSVDQCYEYAIKYGNLDSNHILRLRILRIKCTCISPHWVVSQLACEQNETVWTLSNLNNRIVCRKAVGQGKETAPHLHLPQEFDLQIITAGRNKIEELQIKISVFQSSET
jgi:hypothetical protein